MFHEITEEAIREALEHAHEDVNENLVRAQESRRILDRLYGYTLSPVLWKKVQTGLSAGRVQSVAVRLIVEREEERRAFRTASYWDLEATLRSGANREFGATLAKVDDKRVATGKDFDATGTLTSKTVTRLDEGAARDLADGLQAEDAVDRVGVEEKPASSGPRRRSPRPRCSRKPTASSGSPPSARCRWRSGCSRAWTSAAATSKA